MKQVKHPLQTPRSGVSGFFHVSCFSHSAPVDFPCGTPLQGYKYQGDTLSLVWQKARFDSSVGLLFHTITDVEVKQW